MRVAQTSSGVEAMREASACSPGGETALRTRGKREQRERRHVAEGVRCLREGNSTGKEVAEV